MRMLAFGEDKKVMVLGVKVRYGFIFYWDFFIEPTFNDGQFWVVGICVFFSVLFHIFKISQNELDTDF